MHTHTHHGVAPKTVKLLFVSFLINMLLTLVELGAGIYADSMALIGDALHNTSDAFSILIAIIAYQIGTKKATEKFSYGFKRAETIGGFVNLVLLFIAGVYLVFEGAGKIISPEPINGPVIVIVSVLALIIDTATAKLSHAHAHHNMNMKMLFLHNLADALGSIGVIVSGLFIIFLGWNFVDGIIAVAIGGYMVVQSVMSFPKIVNILMNTAPDGLDLTEIKQALLKIPDIKDVHHMHVWNIDEDEVALDCHIVACDMDAVARVRKVLEKSFDIHHTNIQVERKKCHHDCCLKD